MLHTELNDPFNPALNNVSATDNRKCDIKSIVTCGPKREGWCLPGIRVGGRRNALTRMFAEDAGFGIVGTCF